ncbi:uncharacterized protein J3R85_015188 [Psidium guajava]|nr:uncharacterized protein J3R85_015188 [Psidium guajava]
MARSFFPTCLGSRSFDFRLLMEAKDVPRSHIPEILAEHDNVHHHSPHSFPSKN